MGRRTEQTFFQRGNANGRQTHENMLNITNHQENANQNHNEILPHTCQNGYHQKSLQITNVGKDMEKREPSYTVDGNVNWLQPLWKTVWRFLRKTKNRTTI